MNLLDSMQISASGLTSQRAVINVISENMANAQTTRTEAGGPYLRKRASSCHIRWGRNPGESKWQISWKISMG
jgi:flagellar basal body rod protein FlgC